MSDRLLQYFGDVAHFIESGGEIDRCNYFFVKLDDFSRVISNDGV